MEDLGLGGLENLSACGCNSRVFSGKASGIRGGELGGGVELDVVVVGPGGVDSVEVGPVIVGPVGVGPVEVGPVGVSPVGAL